MMLLFDLINEGSWLGPAAVGHERQTVRGHGEIAYSAAARGRMMRCVSRMRNAYRATRRSEMPKPRRVNRLARPSEQHEGICSPLYAKMETPIMCTP